MGPAVQLHLTGEVHGGSGGAGVGQEFAGFHVIGAEGAVSAEPAHDDGDIVILPEPAKGVLGKLQGHFPALHLEHLRAKLLHSDDKIIGHSVPPIERLSVVGDLGKAVGPLIVSLRGGHDALNGPQAVQGSACGLGEDLPVGLIEHQSLCRFSDRKDAQAAVGRDTALVNIGVHILSQLVFGKVLGKICQRAGLFQFISGIGIGRKEVRHSVRPHLSIDRRPHSRLQIGHRAL